MRPTRLPALALFALSTLIGCGGGGRSHGGAVKTAQPVVAIDWPARSRGFTGSAAATAAQITLYVSSDPTLDVVQAVDRPAGAAAVTTHTALDQPVRPGTYFLRVDFAADASALASPVATAAITVRVAADGALTRADGTPLGSVAVASEIQGVQVAPGQVVRVGEASDLLVSAYTKSGSLVALTPGSVAFTVATGADRLRLNADGSFTGLVEGSASVLPKVDRVVGEPTTVLIDAASLATRSVSAPNSDFVVDPARKLLWLAVPPTESNGNSVRSLDPATGTLGAPIFVGSDPSVLAISDDGSTLYAGLRGAGAVRPIDLASGAASLPFSVGNTGFGEPGYSLDLAVQPGHPRTVALTIGEFGSGGSNGPVVFDEGVARPNRLGVYEGTRLAWTATDHIDAFNVGSSPATVYRADVDANGATKSVESSNVLSTASLDFVLAGGRLYDTQGDVADAVTLERVGSFPLSPGSPYTSGVLGPAIDVAANRAYFVQDTETQGFRLRVFRLDTFLEVANRPLGDVGPSVPFDSRLVRWGAKGLAFSGGDRILLIDDVSGL